MEIEGRSAKRMDGWTGGRMHGRFCRCVSGPTRHLTAPSSPSLSLSCACFCASQLLPRLQLLPRRWSPGGGVTTATAHTAPRLGVSHLRACLWLNVKAITVAAHSSLDNKMFTLGKIIALDVSVTQKPINMWLNRSGCNVSETINYCNRGKKGVITAED